MERRIGRRDCLVRLAAAAAIACAKRTSASTDDKPRSIGLGFSLYGMKSLPLGDALKALGDIGYDCTELPVMPDWPGDCTKLSADARRELRSRIAGCGLRLSALMENLPLMGNDPGHRSNLDRLKRAAELARDLGDSQRRPLIETILGGKPGDFESVKEQMVGRLREWTAVAQDAEVVLAIKAHIGNAVQRPEQLLWLLNEVNSPYLKANFDYSHFQLQGLDLKQALETLLPRTVFIHVKDGELKDGKPRFLLPGEGMTDYVALLKQVAASAYSGDLVVEVSSQISNQASYDPLLAARKCYAFLADAFAKAGLRRA